MNISSPTERLASTTTSGEDERRHSRGPRINFGTPRNSLRLAAAEQYTPGHSRVFSETSIPSSRGNAVKGSLGLENVRNQHPLRNKTSADKGLDPVIEDKVATMYGRETTPNPTQNGITTKPSSATQILRNEADDVRDRLTSIRERLRNDAEKRQLSRDSAIVNQLQALQTSLHEQEDVIDQLERAEDSDVPLDYNPRAEWQQILDRNNQSQVDDRTSSDYDDDEEFESVLEVQEFDDEDLNLDGAHEDRVDAFDYEHFILHSVLGAYSSVDAERRSSTGSATSTETPRALEQSDPDLYRVDSGSDEASQSLRPVESIASFATAQSYVNGDGYGSDGSDVEQDSSELVADQAFPMPPPTTNTNRSRQTSTVSSGSGGSGGSGRLTPTTAEPAADTSASRSNRQSRGHRPASMIFTSLLGPESQSPAWPDLEEEDETVIYTLAEALRSACLQFRRDTADKKSTVDWRKRFEEVKQVLTREDDAVPLSQ